MILTVGHAVAALALTMSQAPAVERHAGVEVGGKGVKVIVIESRRTKDGLSFTKLFGKTNNTTIAALQKGRLQKDAIDDTAKAAADFFKEARDTYNVPVANIHVVGSSGVPRVDNLPDLTAAIRAATGKTISYIDDRKEVALSLLGIVPRAELPESILLDVGSGSTKGGFLLDGELVYASVPLGSVRYAELVQKERKEAKTSFAETAEKLRESKVTAPFRDGLGKSPGLAARKRVYLSGGAPWALVTILHPERAKQDYVTITAADIDAYLKLVRDAKGKMPTADTARIADAELRKTSEAEMRSVANAFSAENLLAGAELLKGLSDAVDLKGKTLIFPRGAYVGWLAAYAAGEQLPPKVTPPPPPPVAKVEPKKEKDTPPPTVAKAAEPKKKDDPNAEQQPEKSPMPKVEPKRLDSEIKPVTPEKKAEPAAPVTPILVVPAAPPVIYHPCPPMVVQSPPVVYYYHCPPPVTVVTYTPCYRPAPVVHVTYYSAPCYRPCAPVRVWCR